MLSRFEQQLLICSYFSDFVSFSFFRSLTCPIAKLQLHVSRLILLSGICKHCLNHVKVFLLAFPMLGHQNYFCLAVLFGNKVQLHREQFQELANSYKFRNMYFRRVELVLYTLAKIVKQNECNSLEYYAVLCLSSCCILSSPYLPLFATRV